MNEAIEMNSANELNHKCKGCQSLVDKLYQRDLCKPCLVQSISGLRDFINLHRAPESRIPAGVK